MKSCVYKKRGIKIKHVWFCNLPFDMEKNHEEDIIFFHDIPKNGNTGVIVNHTTISNLEETEEDLYAKISKTIRYEIRRSDKEEIGYRYYIGREILKENLLLSLFEKTYNQMYRDKGLNTKLNMSLLRRYIAEDMVVITVAYEENEPLVFHTYIYDDEQVRLLHSTSSYRENKEKAAQIARMNKALHWHDMCRFKQMGIKKYDWGGISNPEQPNGIDQFKMSFGGEIVECYNMYLPQSLKGNIILFSMNVKKKLGL